ncbi:hypothetical protein L218DRAFT_955486 [Marasmius fiardii PR-910]|nr:hypothetical protein L218DRAFT_955486 [Marasmius fiardii PR-910]
MKFFRSPDHHLITSFATNLQCSDCYLSPRPKRSTQKEPRPTALLSLLNISPDSTVLHGAGDEGEKTASSNLFFVHPRFFDLIQHRLCSKAHLAPTGDPIPNDRYLDPNFYPQQLIILPPFHGSSVTVGATTQSRNGQVYRIIGAASGVLESRAYAETSNCMIQLPDRLRLVYSRNQ